MRVIFIRHASAEPAGAGGDEARRLTAKGRAESEATAEALKRLVGDLEAIVTSPLARAAETAEIVADAFGGVKVATADFLACPADPAALTKLLGKLGRKGPAAVALVGHAPTLEQYVAHLVAGTTRAGVPLSKAGAACVDVPAEGTGEGPTLRWFMRRKQLAMLAGGG